MHGTPSLHYERQGYTTVEDSGKSICPKELSNAAELRSLAMLQARAQRRAEECTRSPDVLSDKCKRIIRGPPHHLVKGVFVFKRGWIAYQYSCEEMIIKLLEAEYCYSDFPIHPV